ncbi:hypothetical protein Y1Q_0010884 [Alligator mississippiensis]|uniref:Uncharacterized protein n=1 Tax=Alligator mississippiensis TaxID=8496 RepID=A0A151M783_ALLMI|nr:hypothetical protein Y1Q_0010884 [Alligator mississippiensis]
MDNLLSSLPDPSARRYCLFTLIGLLRRTFLLVQCSFDPQAPSFGQARLAASGKQMRTDSTVSTGSGCNTPLFPN